MGKARVRFPRDDVFTDKERREIANELDQLEFLNLKQDPLTGDKKDIELVK